MTDEKIFIVKVRNLDLAYYDDCKGKEVFLLDVLKEFKAKELTPELENDIIYKILEKIRQAELSDKPHIVMMNVFIELKKLNEARE